MKTQTVIIALATALFTAPAFADHNRIDEQGRKQGHWTEFPEVDELLSAEGEYVDGKKRGHWVLRYADGSVEEGPIVAGERHGHWVWREPDGTEAKVNLRNGRIVEIVE